MMPAPKVGARSLLHYEVQPPCNHLCYAPGKDTRGLCLGMLSSCFTLEFLPIIFVAPQSMSKLAQSHLDADRLSVSGLCPFPKPSCCHACLKSLPPRHGLSLTCVPPRHAAPTFQAAAAAAATRPRTARCDVHRRRQCGQQGAPRKGGGFAVRPSHSLCSRPATLVLRRPS